MTFFAPSSPSFDLLLRDSEHRRLPFHEVNVQDALPEQSRDATGPGADVHERATRERDEPGELGDEVIVHAGTVPASRCSSWSRRRHGDARKRLRGDG